MRSVHTTIFIVKIFKRLLYILVSLVFLTLIFIGVVLLADRAGTRYLNLSNHPQAGTTTYLITNVNVVPMTRDTVLRGYSVLIREGVIEKVGMGLDAAGVQVVDGQGRYLLPGLTDMHVHVWDRYELGLYLAHGVTAVRNLWGRPMHLRLKRAVNHNEIIAPLFFTSGPKLTGPEYIGDDNLQLFSVQEAREIVDETHGQGYDFVKTYYGLPEPYFEAVLQRARELDFDIVAHPTPDVPYTSHFRPGIVSLEHAEDIVQQPLQYTLDTLKLAGVVARFAQAPGTSFCPTLTVYHNIVNLLEKPGVLQTASMDYMNPMIRKIDANAQFNRWAGTRREDPSVTERIKAQHAFHLRALQELHQAGVNIVCGTDAGIGITVPGASIHEELAFYREAGLSNYEVLKTATVNPSKVHGFLADLGTIEPGKTANLLLVDENPLQHLGTLKNPGRVFVRGHSLGRETLDQFKAKAADRPNLLASFARYAEYLISK